MNDELEQRIFDLNTQHMDKFQQQLRRQFPEERYSVHRPRTNSLTDHGRDEQLPFVFHTAKDGSLQFTGIIYCLAIENDRPDHYGIIKVGDIEKAMFDFCANEGLEVLAFDQDEPATVKSRGLGFLTTVSYRTFEEFDNISTGIGFIHQNRRLFFMDNSLDRFIEEDGKVYHETRESYASPITKAELVPYRRKQLSIDDSSH